MITSDLLDGFRFGHWVKQGDRSSVFVNEARGLCHWVKQEDRSSVFVNEAKKSFFLDVVGRELREF